MSQGTRYSDIHEAIAEALALVELKESPFDFSRFGTEPKTFVHDTFALAMNDDVDVIHQRRGQPRLVSGTLRIRVAHRVRADNQVADRLAAHTRAEDACNALLQNADRKVGFFIWAKERERSASPDGTYLFTELTFEIQFQHFTEED